MKSRVIHFCIMLFMTQGMMAQLTSLGVIGKSSSDYNYDIEFRDDYLYASSSHGLYRYNLNDSISEWEKLAITDSAVIDFEVRGDTIIALTEYLLYISMDGGKTTHSISVDTVRPYWKASAEKIFAGLASHPSDMKKIHVSLWWGLYYTEDGGTTWVTVDSTIHIEDLTYNPLDEKNLIAYYNYTYADVYVSTDGGFKWERAHGYWDMGRRFINAAFHPVEKDRIVMCGDGIYAMSVDQGHSWTTIDDPNHPFIGEQLLVHLHAILYDSRNPNVLYGADWTYMKEGKIPILRSMDGGFSWQTFYTIERRSDIDCMRMKDNILAIYTSKDNEVLLLDVDAIDASVSAVEEVNGTSSYYDLQGRKVAHPTRGIYIKDGKKVVIK